MKVIRNARELGHRHRKLCLALGFFDGVHLGHQQIIRQTISDARKHEGDAVVITFDRHPNTIVAPDRVPPLIYPLSQKLRTIEALGVHTLLLIHFDHAFSELPGDAFVRQLVGEMGPVHSICVGEHFCFGHRRSGNVGLLRMLGVELGFSVHGLASVELDGEPVSSTRIRKVIQAGDLDQASQMLGRSYSVASSVMAGDQIGRQLGFPTANLNIDGLVMPPSGVYAAHVRVNSGLSSDCRKTWRAVVNIGRRPSLNRTESPLRLEAHLLGFEGDLYGHEVEVVFVEKLRDEIRFASLADLRAQIERDIEAASSKWPQTG